MGAVWYWARVELRGRWRATVALALVVGLAGGAVLTTLAGARRSSTAHERYREETLTSDIDVTTSNPDPARFDAVVQLPQVEVVARSAFPFIIPQGSGLYPYLEFVVIVGPDGKLGTVVDRPRLVEGRMPNPARSDEIAISDRLAAERGLAVGDRVTFESYAPDQFEALFGTGGAGPPAGPLVRLTVTGVMAHPDFLSESVGSFEPRAFLSPAFYREYRDLIGVYEGTASVRLASGRTDVSAVADAIRQIYPDDPALEVQLASELGDKIDESLGVLVVALIFCAAAATLAGMAAVGPALGRHLAPSRTDQVGLAALGMGRRQRIASLAAAVVPVALGGALVAVVVAIVASPLMPIGVARRAEPDPGISVDGIVLGLGFAGVAVIVACLAVVAAWDASAVTIADTAAPTRRGRPSPLRRILTMADLSPAATTGVRLALEPGHGVTAVPVRSAVTGIAAGVAGLVAVVIFAASLADLASTPGRYGFPWDAVVPGFSGEVIEEHGEDLAADPTVRDLGAVTTGLAQIGNEDVNIHAFETLKGSAAPTLLEGRPAARTDEVVLGSTTLRDVGAEVGDTVEMIGAGRAVRLRVVGRAAFPILDERSVVGGGAALTRPGLEQLATADSINRDLLVTWASGVDEAAANRQLEERTGAQVFPPRLPSDVNNLKLVDAIPRALAAFLAILAVMALVHTLATTVRRRRHDLVVLRTLGFVGAQVSATLAWQASTFAVIGLLAGVPLGIAAGRTAWSLVANGIGVADQPVTPLLLFAVIGVAAMLTANLLAIMPARRTRRIRPGAVFRAG